MEEPSPHDPIADDVRTLHRMGYAQELLRRMSGFSNFAISLSIICILAGGINSFHQGLCAVGGASIGIGWPLACLFSLAVAATMGQIASAFPTAGGLYHWGCILGGRGWGWATAWFNLAGLVFVLAAVNVGLYRFALGFVAPRVGFDPATAAPTTLFFLQLCSVLLITFSQALVNHLGIRVTTLLTDFSGYWILLVSVILTAAMLWFAAEHDLSRLWTVTNFSGHPPAVESQPDVKPVWPETTNIVWLFALGLALPAFTITGFDASAHIAEETVGAAQNVPRGIVRSVLVSGVFGWVMLSAILLAIPDMEKAANQGDGIINETLDATLPRGLAIAMYVGIALAQYLCGLAIVTSTSRMTYAFARDGGLPASGWLRHVSERYRVPPFSIWAVAIAGVIFGTLVYETIAIVCTIFLYISYVLPTALGCFAHGRRWTQMGPWHLGPFFRPLAIVSVLFCGLLIAIGMAPPNELAFTITAAAVIVLAVVWFGYERGRFPGPPGLLTMLDQPIAVHEKKAESVPQP
jgi:amino acid transporter